MKKIVILFAVLGSTLNAQEKKDKVRIFSSFQIFATRPIYTGDNWLAKDFRSKLGVKMDIGIIEYKRFSSYYCFDFLGHNVTNKANIGNINRMSSISYYWQVEYAFPVSEDIDIVPNAGLGRVEFDYKAKRIRSFWGAESRLGVSARMNFSKRSSFIIGYQYVSAGRIEVTTHPDFMDYFQKKKSHQIFIGFRLD